MAKEFIIGSAASSAIPVPATARGVSGQHVKITVSDHGRWQLEDLDSANGTYIKDFNGDFQRVFNKVIDENTIIRLGPEGHSSYTFMAHRALGEGDDYAYEFKQLKKRLSEQEQLEAEVEARNARNMKVVKAASPIAMGLCIAAQYCIPGLKSDANLNLWFSRRYRHQGRKATEAAPCQGDDLSQVRLSHLRIRHPQHAVHPLQG